MIRVDIIIIYTLIILFHLMNNNSANNNIINNLLKWLNFNEFAITCTVEDTCVPFQKFLHSIKWKNIGADKW